MTRPTPAFLCLATLLALAAGARAQPTPVLDRLTLGDAGSESAHHLAAEKGETIRGALDQPARRLLPGGDRPWEGGRLRFTMKVDPDRPTYLTARLWGGEPNPNFLILFCEGKQVGYRHLGDVDVLAMPDDDPRSPGRFYDVTTPLPTSMTAGKAEVHLEIRSSGPVWGYAKSFDQYQKPMTQPSRALYALATHTDGCFVPPADQVQGQAPAPTPRTSPGPEVIDEAKRRVNDTLARMMKSAKPLNQMELEFLARAYYVDWCAAHGQQAAVDQVVKGVDELYRRFKANPDELWKDKATWNPEWFGVGPAANAVRLLAKPLAASLDAKIDAKAFGDTTRRAAWSEMFQASRDWLRAHQRWLANQAMFTACNLYLSNRAVAAIDPQHALYETDYRQYLYRAIGLEPFLGAENADHLPDKPFGEHFLQVTDQGLTKELGYVGGYGEVGVANVMEIYDATRDPGGGGGDPRIADHLARMVRARAPFRYRALDDDGHPALRLETAIGWRDTHFPGPVVYVQPAAEQSPLAIAAALKLDPAGLARQMFDDNQFFATLAAQLKNKGLRATFGLLSLPDDYDTVRSLDPTPERPPMLPGQPDFAFADAEDGVVALKRGDELLYASLYWRSRTGINGLARVHRMTPRDQQLAVVHEDVVRFVPSGQTWSRPNWTNFGFANGGFHYPDDPGSALAGESLPIPKLPPGVALANKDNPYAGRADFYQLRFGPYLIAMNTTTDKSFTMTVPPGSTAAPDLVAGHAVPLQPPPTLGPKSAVVLLLGDGSQHHN